MNLTLRDAVLFDGAAVTSDATIAIVDGRFAGEPAPDALVIDVGGAAVIPGLIDLHVHVGSITAEDIGSSDMDAEYLAHRPRFRAAMLAAGVTTIRSVGDLDRAIVRMRVATADGRLEGPRVHCVGPVFTAPGGHPVSTLYARDPELARLGAREVDDPTEGRRQVAALAPYVDGIKVVYSGQPRMPAAVLHAIGDEARRHDLWLAVHTHAIEDVVEATRAGATSVEHGVTSGELLDEATLAELRRCNVTYVPTLAVQIDRVEPSRFAAALENVWRAHANGVRIGAGSDAQGPRMERRDALARELVLLVEAGLSPQDALMAATRVAGEALGLRGELGVVRPGALGDLVIIDGRPWERIEDVRNVAGVVQGGRIVRRTDAIKAA